MISYCEAAWLDTSDWIMLRLAVRITPLMFRVSWVYLPRTWDHFARHSLKRPDRTDPDLEDCAKVIV